MFDGLCIGYILHLVNVCAGFILRSLETDAGLSLRVAQSDRSASDVACVQLFSVKSICFLGGVLMSKAAVIGGALVVGALAAWAVGEMTGFSDEDIANVKAQIRAEFSKREGVEVKTIELMRETPKRLRGFVVVKVAGVEMNKSCNATMSSDGARYIWECP